MIYLFSPIGNTDPIKYQNDGSMLHICRVYKPDVVYLYMSKEILAHHEADNRYVKTIEYLGEKLNHKFDIRLIKRPELVNVQRYDEFYIDFQQELKKIEIEMKPGDRLLVNTASGTPAMKSALNVMAALAEYRFTPIQVSTPKNASNLEHEDRLTYSVRDNWENDLDNLDGFENRCHEERTLHLLALLKKDMIKKHVLAYDYRAAIQIAEEIPDDLSPKALALLKAAEARLNLDWETFGKLGFANLQEFCPIKDSSKNRLFEYALGLKIRMQKGEYADFMRAITPLMVDLLELVLESYCHIRIDAYYSQKKSDDGTVKYCWNMRKLKDGDLLDILNQKFGGDFRGGDIYSAHLNAIIQKKCTNETLKNRIQTMVSVERNIRNIAAHEIVSVTDRWVKQNTGMAVSDILSNISNISEMVKINTKKENWDSYDQMNQYIISYLE